MLGEFFVGELLRWRRFARCFAAIRYPPPCRCLFAGVSKINDGNGWRIYPLSDRD